MSAPNFARENASCIYAVGIDEESQFDFYYDDLADYIRYEVESAIKKENDKNLWFDYYWDDEKWDGRGSYSGQYIGDLMYDFFYMGVEVYVFVRLKIISGYYVGANLDYEIDYVDIYENHYDDFMDLVENVKEYPDEYGTNSGLVAIHIHRFEKKLGDIISKMTSIVENIYEKVSTPLYKAAQFSNGEAIYERCQTD